MTIGSMRIATLGSLALTLAALACAAPQPPLRQWRPMPELDQVPLFRQARGACIAALGPAPVAAKSGKPVRGEWQARFHGCMNSYGWEYVEAQAAQ